MRCIICNNTKDFFNLYPEYSNINNFLCPRCGLVFIPKEKIETDQSYYEKDGYFKKSPNLSLRKWLVSRSLLIAQAKERIATMQSIHKINFNNLRVLDDGCGYGEILFYLKKKYGCLVHGIEASQEIAIRGQEMFNINIEQATLEKSSSMNNYDLILCNHTLEHIENPILFLDMLKSRLSKNGILYIEVPNILKPTGGYSLKKFLYYEHLYNFSKDVLTRLLVKCGFSIITSNDRDFLRFFCKNDGYPKYTLPTNAYREIKSFLNLYSKNYSLFSYFKVYFFKFQYLLKLCKYKLKDFFNFLVKSC